MQGEGLDIQERSSCLVSMADIVTPMAIRAAVEIGLADHLDAEPTTAEDAAVFLGVDARVLSKLLAHLVELEIVRFDDEGFYHLDGYGEPLLSRCDFLGVRQRLDRNHVSGRAEMALIGLTDTVRTGVASYEAVHGKNLWNDLEGAAGELGGINELEYSEAAFDAALVVEADEWSRVSTVVDVGGNNGALLHRLLLHHPHLHGTLIDLGRSAEVARKRFRREGLEEKVRVVSGSFFDPLPDGADVYLLSSILADWSDADCVRILRRCAEAAPEDSLVILAEVHMSAPHTGDELERSRMNLWLEASMTRPDRSVADLERLAREAGLEVLRSGPHSKSRSMIVLTGAKR